MVRASAPNACRTLVEENATIATRMQCEGKAERGERNYAGSKFRRGRLGWWNLFLLPFSNTYCLYEFWFCGTIMQLRLQSGVSKLLANNT